MIRNGYTEIEHTADLGIEICAASIEELFIIAAEGYYDLAIEKTDPFISGNKIEIDFDAESLEELLVTFLSELNYLLMTKYSVPESLRLLTITHKGDIYNLSFNSRSFKIIPAQIKNEIKAVTYHQLKIDFKNDCYRTKIFFDI